MMTSDLADCDHNTCLMAQQFHRFSMVFGHEDVDLISRLLFPTPLLLFHISITSMHPCEYKLKLLFPISYGQPSIIDNGSDSYGMIIERPKHMLGSISLHVRMIEREFQCMHS